MQKLTVTNEFHGQRLDKFLREKLPNLSRSQIQKQIKSGSVRVNGKNTAVHHFLKADDAITVEQNKINSPVAAQASLPAVCDCRQAGAPALDDKKMQPLKTIAQAFQPELQLNVIADTDDYLIINKQAGLLVHEAPGEHGPTVVDLVLEKYPDVRKIGEDPMRPGIVHRLDKDVSGLLVVAKTQDMFDHLKQQFKSRKTKKEYYALVYGAPQRPEGEITFNIDRSETQGHKMAAVPASGNGDRGRKAITEFEIIEQLGNYTYLRIKPKTGRTHQIRVHLNAFGLPIVGDAVYRPRKLKVKIILDRVFLHAHYLGFSNLSGEWQEYSAPLPKELEEVLAQIKNS